MASHNLPILTRDSNGAAVKLVQKLLNAYPIPGSKSLKEDGIFGSNTIEAVKNFQTHYSQQNFDVNDVNILRPATLEADGKVGNLTWRALGDFVYKNSPASQS